MKTKHTPGPWKVMAQNTNRPRDLFSVIGNTDADERKHSVVCNSCDIDDAKLIAAAPDLLEALQSVVEAFTTAQLEDVLGFEKSVAVREAISKATK